MLAIRTPEQLYEQARSAGLSHATATEVAHATMVRGRISGDWPDIKAPPVKDTGYDGPAPTIDSALWLKKLGHALTTQWTQRLLVARELSLVTNARVQLVDWEKDGCLRLDLEHRHIGGRRAYTTCRIPVSACLEHDTEWVLARVLSHLGQRNVTMIENTILNETDLRHVSG